MGMLIEGKWSESVTDNRMVAGAFIRQRSQFSIRNCCVDVEPMPKRYHLFSSWSCPWSQRAMIVRSLKGLHDAVSMTAAWGPRIEGYSILDGARVRLPGTAKRVRFLHEVYTASDPSYTGRVTVPVLWDSEEQQIVSNESDEISLFFDSLYPDRANFKALVDEKHTEEILLLNQRIYHGFSNAVYEAGYAQSQSVYEEKVSAVFETLDWLESRLTLRKFLVGDQLSLADVYVIPPLLRFSAIYYPLFKCNIYQLSSYHHIGLYIRRMMADQRIRCTFNLHLSKVGYFLDERLNPSGIIPIGPSELEWI